MKYKQVSEKAKILGFLGDTFIYFTLGRGVRFFIDLPKYKLIQGYRLEFHSMGVSMYNKRK